MHRHVNQIINKDEITSDNHIINKDEITSEEENNL